METILFQSNYAPLTKGGQKSIWYSPLGMDKTKYKPVLFCREDGDLTIKARVAGIPVDVKEIPQFRILYICRSIKFIVNI
jgi:hypothetical protein